MQCGGFAGDARAWLPTGSGSSHRPSTERPASDLPPGRRVPRSPDEIRSFRTDSESRSEPDCAGPAIARPKAVVGYAVPSRGAARSTRRSMVCARLAWCVERIQCGDPPRRLRFRSCAIVIRARDTDLRQTTCSAFYLRKTIRAARSDARTSRSPRSRSRSRPIAVTASSRARCIPMHTCGPWANATL